MRQIPSYPLWLGHTGDARNLPLVLSTGIVAIVDLAIDEPPPKLTRELVYCRFPLLDGAGNPEWILRSAIETVEGLLRSQTPTLVFCGAGMSRSPAIAATGIARVSGLSLAECLGLIWQTGPVDLSPGL